MEKEGTPSRGGVIGKRSKPDKVGEDPGQGDDHQVRHNKQRFEELGMFL